MYILFKEIFLIYYFGCKKKLNVNYIFLILYFNRFIRKYSEKVDVEE